MKSVKEKLMGACGAARGAALGGALGAAALFAGCGLGTLALGETNGAANRVAYTEVPGFAESLLPSRFGTSSGATGNKVFVGPYTDTIQPATGALPVTNEIPEGYLSIRATGGAGKIAGSEDGITFLYREVDASKNFILEADFVSVTLGNSAVGKDALGKEVEAWSPQDATIGSNGQEGWGIMARDFIPAYSGMSPEKAEETASLIASHAEANPGVLGLAYYNDKALPSAGSSGGDSNMILVGAVKRGMRVYWRQGATPSLDNQYTDYDDDGTPNGNPTTTGYQNAGTFSYTMKELPDYTFWTQADDTGALVNLMAARPDYPTKGLRYHLKLEKTNTDFVCTITAPPEKDLDTRQDTTIDREQVIHVPLYDILTSVNRKAYYVGFFAARDGSANIDVSSIKYYEADAADCAPYIEPDPVPVAATLEVLSPAAWGGEEYLYVKSNMAGALSVNMNGRQIPPEAIYADWTSDSSQPSAKAYTLFTVPTYTHKMGTNTFSITFYPSKTQSGLEAGQVIKDTKPLEKTFVVTKKFYQDGTGDIYAAPKGKSGGTGSEADPLDIQTAVTWAAPGQTVILKDGVYTPLHIEIPRYHNGSYTARKTVKAEHRDKAIIDFRKEIAAKTAASSAGTNAGGFTLAGNYWVLEGFHVRNTPDKLKGLVVAGKNNNVKWIKTYSNGDTGMQISGASTEAKRLWPSGNKIEYCESYNNRDEAHTDADGFAAKLTVGEDNEFHWCVSHNNCDDGWDLFTKRETGATGVVRFYHCVSYRNGHLMDPSKSGSTGGNGFKLGGEGIPVLHEIHQSLSFQNLGDAVTSNSNPALMIYNVTAGTGRLSISSGDGLGTTGIITDSLIADGADFALVWDGTQGDLPGVLGPDPSGYFSYEAAEGGATYMRDTGFLSRDAEGKFILGDLYYDCVSYGELKGAYELYANHE